MDEITDILDGLAKFSDEVIESAMAQQYSTSEPLSDLDAESLYVVLEHIKDVVCDGVKKTTFRGALLEE